MAQIPADRNPRKSVAASEMAAILWGETIFLGLRTARIMCHQGRRWRTPKNTQKEHLHDIFKFFTPRPANRPSRTANRWMFFHHRCEATIRSRFSLTRRVFDAYVTVPPNVLARTRPGGFGTLFQCSTSPSKEAAATATASNIRFMSAMITAVPNW